MKTVPRTIDEYLASLSAEPRAALEKLRRDIHAAAPRVEECISYQMPAFRLDGKVLVWFRASSAPEAVPGRGVLEPAGRPRDSRADRHIQQACVSCRRPV